MLMCSLAVHVQITETIRMPVFYGSDSAVKVEWLVVGNLVVQKM